MRHFPTRVIGALEGMAADDSTELAAVTVVPMEFGVDGLREGADAPSFTFYVLGWCFNNHTFDKVGIRRGRRLC